MARSLVVRHDETARTSLLFTSFLVLSCGLLAAGWWLGDAETLARDVAPAVQAVSTP